MRGLAKQFDVSYSAVAKVAANEKWSEAKAEQRIKIELKVNQESLDKISDSESEIAAIRSRVHLKLMQEVERQTDAIMSGDMNSADLRRIVQSYKDMCDIVVETVGDEKQHNALVSAIREAAERRRGHD